jgi:hypothetical protein
LRVAEQSTWQKVGLGQDLETVTDTEYRASALRELFQWPHDVRKAGDCAGSEVVAVGEAARNDHGVDTLEVRVRVPQLDRLGAHALHTVERIPVAV